jgi:hypothetical protein
VSKIPFLFRSPDGVTWNAYGHSRTSEGDERRLPSTMSYLTEWYEWVTHSPQSEIVRAVKVLPSQL